MISIGLGDGSALNEWPAIYDPMHTQIYKATWGH